MEIYEEVLDEEFSTILEKLKDLRLYGKPIKPYDFKMIVVGAYYLGMSKSPVYSSFWKTKDKNEDRI